MAEAIKALSTCLAQRQCPISFIADTGSEMRGARKTLAVKICGVPFVKMVIIPLPLPPPGGIGMGKPAVISAF